jgi:hypothetical protein
MEVILEKIDLIGNNKNELFNSLTKGVIVNMEINISYLKLVLIGIITKDVFSFHNGRYVIEHGKQIDIHYVKGNIENLKRDSLYMFPCTSVNLTKLN